LNIINLAKKKKPAVGGKRKTGVAILQAAEGAGKVA